MTKPLRNFLLVVICLPTLVSVLVGINYLLISHLLHLDRDLSPAEQAGFVPVAKPLVLAMSSDMRRAAEETLLRSGIRSGVDQIPKEHPLLIDISWIQSANPYPPLLAEIGGYRSSYFSFGYLGADERYHQVTLSVGETDTLPTFLVEKVRGRRTLGGDYFAQYLFHLSREMKLIDPNGPPNQPQIDSIEWASFRGGSYDGSEEILGNAAATLAELLLIGVVGAVVLARNRR